MIRNSRLALVKTIFAHAEATSDRRAGGAGGFANRRAPQKKSFFFSRKQRGTPKATGGGTKGKKKNATLGSEFRQSLEDLMFKLQQSTPQFIRCLKPNPDKAAGNFIDKQVAEQLRYCGVMETVKIRAKG